MGTIIADRHTFEISQAELGALKNYNKNVIIVFPDGHEGLKIVQRPLFEGQINTVSLYDSIYSETDKVLIILRYSTQHVNFWLGVQYPLNGLMADA